MSIISSLLLFLLCISFHACNARSLAAVRKDPAENKFHLPNKNEEISVAPRFNPALSSENGAANGEEMVMKQHRANNKHELNKPRSLKSDEELKKGQLSGVKISGAAAKIDESLIPSVSWRLPRKKRGEKQPGFNLDYSPPKTHPPVHN